MTAKKRLTKKSPELAPCALCEKSVDKKEHFCSGCNHVICKGCDKAQPWGQHDVMEHDSETEDDD